MYKTSIAPPKDTIVYKPQFSPAELERIRKNRENGNEYRDKTNERRNEAVKNPKKVIEGSVKAHHHFDLYLAPYAAKGTTYEKWLNGNHIPTDAYDDQIAWMEYYPIFIADWGEHTGLPLPSDILFGAQNAAELRVVYERAVASKGARDTESENINRSLNARLIDETKKNLHKLYKKDWAYMTEEEQEGLVLLWKSKHPGFTEGKNRMILFKNLMEDDFGSAYANVNNLNSYTSLNDSPIEPGKGLKEIEDEFYNDITARSFTILDWYEHGLVKGYLWSGTKWGLRIRTPNPGAWASREARHIKGDLENNKYLITVAVLIGFGISMLAIVAGS